MSATKRRARRSGESGVALVEFSIVLLFFSLTVFGVVEFGFYFWELGAITKGAQEALRYAVVSDPVTNDWDSLQPGSSRSITCEFSGGAVACAPQQNAPNSLAMDCIAATIKQFAPFIDPQNVVISYSANDIGVVGAIAPTVELRLRNVKFPSLFFAFLGDRLLPELNFTMTAEDMRTAAPTSINPNQCGLTS